MVGRLLSYWVSVTFQGRTVKLREGTFFHTFSTPHLTSHTSPPRQQILWMCEASSQLQGSGTQERLPETHRAILPSAEEKMFSVKKSQPGNSAGDLFEMVEWPFGKVKWPPTRGSKDHFESPVGESDPFFDMFWGDHGPTKRQVI